MCPRGPIATDGHRNNEYPFFYDELPILYTHVKEDLVASMSMNKCWRPIIGCTQPERRSVTISSITIQVFPIDRAGEKTAASAHGHVCSSAARTSRGRRNLSLHARTNRYRRHARVSLMVTIMAIARGSLSWGIKGAPNPQSSKAILSLG